MKSSKKPMARATGGGGGNGDKKPKPRQPAPAGAGMVAAKKAQEAEAKKRQMGQLRLANARKGADTLAPPSGPKKPKASAYGSMAAKKPMAAKKGGKK